MASVDRLCTKLGINNPLIQATCIGYGTRRPDCGCAVALASRSAAYALLLKVENDVNRRLDVTDKLRQVASLLLCKRWHQYQTEENLSKWQTSLKGYVSPSQRTSGTATTSRTSRPMSEPKRKETPMPTSIKQELEEMKKKCKERGNMDLLRRLNEIEDEFRDARSQVDDSEGDGDKKTGKNQEEEEAPSLPQRQSHVECVVCFLPYSGHSADHWECTKCLNRLHQECFDSWSASLSGERAVRCVHCRAEV